MTIQCRTELYETGESLAIQKSTELDESGKCSDSKSLPPQKKTEMLFSEQKHSHSAPL